MTIFNQLLQKFNNKNSSTGSEEKQIDIVSIAAHEFRTYLTNIINYLSVLSEESKTKLDPEEQVFLDRAFINAQQLSCLVDNLLNMSRLERGVFNSNPQPMDWQKNLNQVVENNRLQASQKNITLELTPPSQPLPKVLADLVKINEVLNNLITNAINYNQAGGWIKVKARVEGNEVITSISDNGIGIPQEALPRLFTKFFRVTKTPDQRGKGTGLGLYISKSIIDLHHGKIWAQSEEGKGSTFYFSLPIAQ